MVERRSTEDRQVELADAALRIIATRGIAALTTRSLAEEVGLTTGAIFRHFASLDAVLDAVSSRVEAVLEATYPPAELPPLERLDRFIEARSAAVGARVGIFRLLLSDQFVLALPEGSAARLRKAVQKTRGFVLACVRDGQRRGEVRADLDATALAVVALGALQMLVLATANPADHAAEARPVRAALRALLTPATPPPGAPARRRK